MTRRVVTAGRAGLGRRRTLRERLLALLPISAVWVLLWGELSWGNVIGGLLVGAAVTAVLPLPPLHLEGRVSPAGVLRLALRFAGDVVVSSIKVAWAALRPHPGVRNAIIGVSLQAGSDLNLALTSALITLVPGSVVIEVVREAGVLYVHLFDIRDQKGIEEMRRHVLEVERLVVRAFGSKAERNHVGPAGPGKETTP